MRVMRFLDSSVFLHAYLKPRRKLKPREVLIKNEAKNIIENVDNGKESVLTTVVHLSEVFNIVESRLGLRYSIYIASRIFSLKNVEIAKVDRLDYEKALAIAERYNVSLNDALAYTKMGEYNIEEIYTFNKHFKNLPVKIANII